MRMLIRLARLYHIPKQLHCAQLVCTQCDSKFKQAYFSFCTQWPITRSKMNTHTIRASSAAGIGKVAECPITRLRLKGFLFNFFPTALALPAPVPRRFLFRDCRSIRVGAGAFPGRVPPISGWRRVPPASGLWFPLSNSETKARKPKF